MGYLPNPDIRNTRCHLGGTQAAFTRQKPPKRNIHSGLRKARTSGSMGEVRFGVRTSQGDTMEITPSERLQDTINLAFEREQRKADLLKNVGSKLSNAELPDHW